MSNKPDDLAYRWKDTENPRVKKAHSGYVVPEPRGLGHTKATPIRIEAHNAPNLPAGEFGIYVNAGVDPDYHPDVERIVDVNISAQSDGDSFADRAEWVVDHVVEALEALTDVELEFDESVFKEPDEEDA